MPGTSARGPTPTGRTTFRDVEHLARVAALFLVFVVGFMTAQRLFTPPGFGRLGHYRPGALADNAGRPSVFAGRAACEECHTDVAEAKHKGKHAGVGCEACHGALAAHASDPAATKPVRPDARTLCLKCHASLVGRPASFPQIKPAEHVPEGASCIDCHAAHDPALGGTK
jgi:predicted CXXCH cytochrome family protein